RRRRDRKRSRRCNRLRAQEVTTIDVGDRERLAAVAKLEVARRVDPESLLGRTEWTRGLRAREKPGAALEILAQQGNELLQWRDPEVAEVVRVRRDLGVLTQRAEGVCGFRRARGAAGRGAVRKRIEIVGWCSSCHGFA